MELPKIFGYVGAATLGALLVRLLQELHLFLRPSSLSRYRTPGKETWAFVSGASDGIGLGFAQELCQRGFNVFLHGRNRDKLLSIQEQLRTTYPSVQTKIIVFDALNPNEDMDRIVREIGDAHLTVLVNNIGGCLLSGPPYVRLQNITYKQMNDMITVNTVFMTNLTRLLLPTLLKNAPGLIMNISSATSFGLPWLTVYAGTKGFVNSFSKSLAAEMRAEGEDVEVLAVIVGSVKTAGNDVDEGVFTPKARKMASASLDRVGCGWMVTWGYWLHRLQGIGFEILPLKVIQGMAANAERELLRQFIEKEKRK
jgi:17beta-estradiol 17-dehydrogenase / very-long-chain 3-oxoacyl-CoA reductase